MKITTKNVIGGTILTPSEVRSIYLYGVKTTASDGRSISDDTIQMYIESAQREIEGYLDIKIIPQKVTETKSYRYDDVVKWGYLETSYPVRKALSVKGKIGNIQRIEYPKDWLVVREASDETYFRVINIVPASSPIVNTPTMLGVLPLTMYTNSHIPHYWDIQYHSGYQMVPMELVNFIGKLASINVFQNLGDLILGAGISSQSIGIDGLSQSISTTKNGDNSAFGARIKSYQNDLKESLGRIKTRYRGIKFIAL